MENNYSVYIHRCPCKKVYIGITQQKPELRWKYGYGYQTQRLFYRAIQKYGWENIEHKILFTNLTKEEAEQKEIELIAKYKSNNIKYGYNIENGGNSIGKISERTKEKISFAHKGKHMSKRTEFKKGHIVSETTRERLRKANKNKKGYWQGKKRDNETKEKIRLANTGKHHTQEAKLKISASSKGRVPWNKGKKLCEETKKKISENNAKFWLGKKMSEETKKKLSLANTGKHHTEEAKIKIGQAQKGKKLSEEHKRRITESKYKPIICIETQIIYDSAKSAENLTGITRFNICCNLKHRSKSAGGYHWEYVIK